MGILQLYTTAKSNAHNRINQRPTAACVTLCVLDNALLEISNTQCRINHLATKTIDLDPGKIRPSIFFIFFLLQVTTDVSPKIYQI